MNARQTLCRLLPLSLSFALLAPACDGGSDNATGNEATKAKEKDAPKTDEATPAQKPADAKPAEKPEVKPAEKPEVKPAEAEESPADAEDVAEPAAADTKAKADAPKPKPKPKPTAGAPKKDDAKPAASTADGKAIYLKKCKSCHGVSGAADTKLAQKHDIESWKEPGWKGRWSLSKIKDIVTNGEPGTKMKSFKTKLTAEEIDAVSAYSRSLGK